MFLFSAIFCAFLVICQIVLPVCCQSSEEFGPRNNNFDDVETLERHVDTLGTSPNYDRWSRISTPSTPRPEDVDCYVEIPTTQRVGGTCVSYGENTQFWLCQSGVNAQVNTECAIRAEQHRMMYVRQQQSEIRRRRRFARHRKQP